MRVVRVGKGGWAAWRRRYAYLSGQNITDTEEVKEGEERRA